MRDRDPARFLFGRHAGVMVPLFSIPSHSSWGIGEIPDLLHLTRWLASVGMDFVQLLPVNEMQEGQNSPYSALSAMAIDPIFIALADVEDFRKGESSLTAEERARLDAARGSSVVDYATVRQLKARALHEAFLAFDALEWCTESGRASQFREFTAREAWWLDDYALFRALHEENHARYWVDWDAPLRDRDKDALAAAASRLARPVRYFKYLQWLADQQWQRARRASPLVGIFGDFPFMVSAHSADVWARQDEFRVDASVGVPPDAFSETGQDWGLPAYRWDVQAERGYEWLRDRTRRSAELYDGFRVDHLVGFYRTYVRERDGSTSFVPADEPTQKKQGEELLALFASCGSRIIGEDLGTVPKFVRESMSDIGVPGLKVVRWEREWTAKGQPFLDPAGYPTNSVATSGTHDTETLAEWWDGADQDERRRVLALPALAASSVQPDSPFSARVRDAFLAMLFASRSDLLILPIQDVFGWRERINTPASTGDTNWTWRLPWPVDHLLVQPEPAERAAVLRRLARRHHRAP